jgi:N-acetyl sugar amidotransferase
MKKMQYCTNCLYPASSAVSLSFNEEGVCSGCLAARQKKIIDWDARKRELLLLANEYKNRNQDNYDCIIPVSGGKDSYFQTHVAIKDLGLKPLLVTYHGNNYSPEGEYNLGRMRDIFNADHIIFRPPVEVLKVLNKAAFLMMGDMNWHAHVGIYTYPAIMAVKHNVPLMIWGEHGRTEVGGMYSLNDYIEMTAKYVREHAGRGFVWEDFVKDETGLSPKDLTWLRYPSDDDLFDLEIRGIHLNNYIEWDPNTNTELIIKEYGWRQSSKKFDRTYRVFSNLDDIHENGAHDYLKFIKFGYGRCTDHASKDIRAGKMTRDEGIKLVREYDSNRPSDLDRWLAYVDMSEDDWNSHCDTLRDPRVWWIKDGQWMKDNLWGEPSAYGTVTNKETVSKFASLGLVT